MGDKRTGSGRAGRHRRTRTPLLERREHRRAGRRDRSLPAPTPSALVGIAVLVLIGFGVIHLSSTGSAVPLEDPPTVTAPGPSAPAEQSEAAGSEDGTAEADEPDGTTESGEPDPAGEPEEATGAGETEGELIIHVSGAVAAPGVVRLTPGSRVDDALQAAGGATGDADLASVNLARPLVDGEQVHVPVPGEESHPAAGPPPEPDTEGEDDGSGGAGPGGTGPVDLNTATASQLEELPGVGPAIAQRIIDHREKNGPFRSVDDLIEVSGIGPATLEKLRDRATVSS